MRTELVDLLGESPCRQVALRRHWRVVEEQIGRELPEDYRWFVEEYGDALIAGSLYVPHPASLSDFAGSGDLPEFIDSLTDSWQKALPFLPKGLPERVEAVRDEVIPWADHTYNGDTCLLLPPAPGWPKREIAILFRQCPDVAVFEGGVVEFIHRLLIQGIWPRGWPTGQTPWTPCDDDDVE
ncbi:SMI1/KNR4 family protein [Streptomyces bohaiensis]|uniref:SMI1/KNR4 family protein n=1 Tax=Streptomyces bohaiensis TaxID=1431344 RepID=UPI003B794C98